MDSVAINAVIAVGGLVIGAFFRGLAAARKADAVYVPRAECVLCGKATSAGLEGITRQLDILLRLHTEEKEARHRLANSLQIMSNVLYKIQGSLGPLSAGKSVPED